MYILCFLKAGCAFGQFCFDGIICSIDQSIITRFVFNGGIDIRSFEQEVNDGILIGFRCCDESCFPGLRVSGVDIEPCVYKGGNNVFRLVVSHRQ